MLRDYTEMFKPVCDFVKSSAEILPYGNHSSLFRSCAQDSHLLFQDALQDSELEQHEVEKAAKVYDFVTSMYELFLEKAVNPEWSSLSREQRLERIDVLKNKPQVEQRTDAWYKQTANLLTASEFSSLLGSPRQRASLVQSKVNAQPKEYLPQLAFPSSQINALTWGIRFEPVVKQILEKQWTVRIHDLGRLLHPTDTHLAASPDGLIVEANDSAHLGRLVEIKCPYSRKVGGEVPLDYWIQMQIQMEVANIDECNYVEVEILSTRADKPAPTKEDLSGCLHTGEIRLWEKEGAYEYEYVGLDIPHEHDPQKEGYELRERIPWGIQKLHHVVVQRDKMWFQSTDVWRAAFWEDVERSKAGTALLVPAPPPLPEKQKLKVCLIKDDS